MYNNIRSERFSMKIEVFSIFLGWIFPVVIPIVHIVSLWYFWGKYHFPVNKSSCTCECWDSIFKGPYEIGISSYKNFYFNATNSSLKIWILTATGIVIIYECTKYISQLLLRGKLRFSMLVLYLSSIFPNYYSWWTYINYMNDSYYTQWDHQMFFTVTEVISTAVVINLLNVHHEITVLKMLTVLGISSIHMVAGGIDQFVVNVILMEGSPHQVIRDFGFMIPDILHVIIPIIEITDIRESDLDADTKKWYTDKCFVIEILITILFIIIGCVTVSQL